MMKSRFQFLGNVLRIIFFGMMAMSFGLNDSLLAQPVDSPVPEDEMPCRATIPDAIIHHEGLPAVTSILSEGMPMTARAMQKNQHTHQLSVREISKKHTDCCRLAASKMCCVFPPYELLTDGWYTYRRGVLII